MIDSRCGLRCTDCGWKQSCRCGGCIETMGHPFHGECPIAICCQNKGYGHCGECDMIPCDKLYAYSYLDPVHGDKPQGERVDICRRRAAESGKNVWGNVLLTSAGFEDSEGGQKQNIVNCFLKMLDKPINKAKILFIPTAAIDEEAKKMADLCWQELIRIGAKKDNIRIYNIGEAITENEAMLFDVIYFTGGDTVYLLRRIKEAGFDSIIKKMAYANKVYVGVSAGSMIASPNIGKPYSEETSGLCLINAYLSVHFTVDTQAQTDFPLPHISLTNDQAVVARWDGYNIIEG